MAQTLDAATGVQQFSFSGCPPTYLSNADTPCATWTRTTTGYFARHDAFRQVVVTYRIHAALWATTGTLTPPALAASITTEARRIWFCCLLQPEFMKKATAIEDFIRGARIVASTVSEQIEGHIHIYACLLHAV